MKFNHALLAVDLSSSSDDMIYCMSDLKAIGINKVTLITAVSNPYPGGPEKFDKSGFEKKLTGYSAAVAKQGFESDWILKVESGTYAPVTILKTADEIHADILIIGHRGHNRLSELFLGSVANEILQRANMPLLLLRISDNPGDSNVSICRNLTEKILVATDFSENADKAVNIIADLHNPDSSAIHLVHVKTRNEDNSEDQKLKELVESIPKNNFKDVQGTILKGNTAFEINKFADDQNCTLIVMGSQGKGFIKELFIGSNSVRVARFTSKPLLLIPARD